MITSTLSPLQPDPITRKEFTEFKGEMRNFRLEFNDFKDEMYTFKSDMHSFREYMYAFKGEIYKFRIDTERRLDKLSKDLCDFRKEIPRHMEILREGFREDLKSSLEFLKK